MRNKGGVIPVVLVLLLLLIPVLGDTPKPDHLSVHIVKQGLIANGTDSTGISVTVYDTSNNPINGLPVDFILENPDFGQFLPSSAITSDLGSAETQFKVNTNAGHAQFSIRVEYIENGSSKYQIFTSPERIWIQNPIPDIINFTTTKEWLIANGTDYDFARISVKNRTYPIPGLGVSYQILEPEMGYFPSNYAFTNDQGEAESQFVVKYKSGNATLKAFIKYEYEGVETIVENQTTQRIDHDFPYALASYDVPSEAQVGSEINLTMAYRDRWGNPIDSRNIAENVIFMVSSPNGDASFINNNRTNTTIPVDEKGYAIAGLRVSKSPSMNVVRVDPDMGTIPDNYYFINIISNRTPVYINQTFEPEGIQGNPPKVYADGKSSFAITYLVTDEFHNGVMYSPVLVTVFDAVTGEVVENKTLYTNSIGQILLTFGPKSSIGKYRIVAQAIATYPTPPYPSCSKEVWFVSQEAQDLQLTAVPDTMASRDVDGWQPALLMAKVIDESGNPVEGETVNFSLGTPSYEATPFYPVVIRDPELVSTSAQTNSDGFAIVYFNPGEFTRNWTDPFYDDTASGNCIATAHWENVTRGKSSTKSILLTWKNYPYLSIETDVYPQTVNVSGIINVKVSLKGDGWALRPKPIDAVLCTDRSGSMLKDEPDRMIPVINASGAFVTTMHVGPTRDHIGLISFGTNGWAKLAPVYRYLDGTYYCYRSGSGFANRNLKGWFYDWTNVYGVSSTSTSISSSSFRWVYRDNYWDTPIIYNTQNYWPYTEIYHTNSEHQQYINTYYPGDNRNYGDYAVVESPLTDTPSSIITAIRNMVPTGGTPMRYGIYRAINEIISNGRNNAIKAIVLLSDGDYNYYGDPLARGTGSDSCNPTSYGDLSSGYCKFSGLGNGIDSNQNMSNYAKNNNIKIFSIGYANEITTGGRDTLRILAESTGGQYFDGNSANIEEIYTIIAGKLQEEAGVDTFMDMRYDKIEVNYDIIQVNGSYKVFTYIPSTDIDLYDLNMTRPSHDPPYPYSIDQSEEFNQTNRLTFNVGTIKLGQTWEATYKLKVLVDGTINVFGNGSYVYFNGTFGPSQLRLPKTYITGVPNMTSEGVNYSALEFTNFESSISETNIITWQWTREYTGVKDVIETCYLSIDDGKTWILVKTTKFNKEDLKDPKKKIGSYSVNRNQFPPDAKLKFRVVGNALDAPGPVINISLPPPHSNGIAGKAYIKLK
ncbi:MAG: Ig-like domain-containing protein [Methanolinea sp.]|nr:Ig-like domain-containing protein [Methanolinea sp.]